MTNLRVLLIDSAVENYQHLIQDIAISTEVIVIQPDQDGVHQIIRLLQEFPHLQELHVLAHGAPGCLFLGNAQLSLGTLQTYEDALQHSFQHWSVLNKSVSLFLYGCNVAAGDAGAEFIARLHHLTGAHIAASTTPIGNALRGGNWELDYAMGAFGCGVLARTNTDSIFAPVALATYAGLLNAPPVITDGLTLTRTTPEDTALTIRNLSIADEDLGDLLTVTLTVSAGTLTLSNTTGLTSIANNNSASVQIQGSIAAINQAIDGMVFTPLTDDSGNKTLSIQVNDGVNAVVSQTVAIAVTPVNDAPTIAPIPLIVTEGGTVNFVANDLNLNDIDNISEQRIIKIDSLPSRGVLLFAGNRVVPGSTFSSDQIAQLSYRHDGTQTTAPGGTGDSFTITVDDGAGGIIGVTTVPITITPVNQPPAVISNNRLFEGQTDYRVTLSINDVDQTNSGFSIEILSLPQDGILRLQGEANPLTIGRVLTSADLANLVYSHDGNDDNNGFPPPDSFQVRAIDDGGGTGVPGATIATITLSITPNNDDPILNHNTGLSFDPTGGTLSQVITPAQLQVIDPDSATTQLAYTLTEIPDATLGTLQRFAGGSWQTLGVGATFTQDDINDGRLRYVFHRISSGGESFSDRFRFVVRDSEIREYPSPREGGIWDGAALAVNTFNIAVNIPPGSNGGSGNAPPTNITGNNPPTIDLIGSIANLVEGGTATITRDLLRTVDTDNSDAQIIYRITELPTSGAIWLNGRALGLYESFSQQDINDNRVTFRHAGGEDFIDRFKFTVSDGTDRPGVPFEGTFNIDITPVNDAPTVTVTGSPNLVEGGSVVIDERFLRLGDVDGSGEKVGQGFARVNGLTFRVTGLATHGELQVFRSGTWTTVDSNTVITEAELNSEQFRYVHDGSENFADSFVVEAIDDSGAANNISTGPVLSRTVNLEIARLNDPPASLSTKPLTVTEGGTGTIRGFNGLNGPGVADDDPNLIYQDPDNTTIQRQFRITGAPAQGTLLLNGRALSVGSVFTQNDLDSDRITYRHNGSENYTDGFAFEVRDGGGVVVPGNYDIFVTPRNDAPTLTVPTTQTFSTVAPLVFNSANGNRILVNDIDLDVVQAGETDILRVTLDLQASGSTYTGSTLTLGSITDLSISEGISGTAGGRIVFEGTRSAVQAALDGLRVQVPTDEDRQLSLVVTVDDRLNGDPAIAPTGVQVTRTIAINASNFNDTPTLTAPATAAVNEDGTLRFNGGTGTGNASFISINDVDDFGAPMSITVSLGGNPGSLNATGMGVSGNGTGTLTITGTKTEINAILQSLQYSPSANFNTINNGIDTPIALTITVNDNNSTGETGGPATLTQTVQVTVNPLNDSPTLTVPAGVQSINSDNTLTFASGAIAINDPFDLASQAVDLFTVTISAQQVSNNAPYGSLSTTASGSATIGGTGTDTLTITGTRAEVNATLGSLTYTPAAFNVDDSVRLRVVVNDGNNGAEGTGSSGASPTVQRDILVNISGTNDAPVLTAPTNSLSVNEDATLTLTGAGNLFSFADPDDFGASNLTATITVTHGTLSLLNADGTTVGGSGTATLTLTGTEAQINNALDGLRYTPNTNFHGNDTLTVLINDQGNTGVGGVRTHERTVSITVNPVNDQPTATESVMLGAIAEDTGNPTGVLISSLITTSQYSDATDDQAANGGNNTSTNLSYIAIVGDNDYTPGQGTWQFSNGTGGWIDIPTSGLSVTNAIVIPANRELRFVPAVDFHGTPGSLIAHLADGSTAISPSTGSSSYRNLNLQGGMGTTGAWSANPINISITGITPVNDAPTINDAATPSVLTASDEDATSPSGSPISSLFGGKYRDSTDNKSSITGGGNTLTPFGGIAVVNNPATASEGVWQYRIGTGTWQDVPTSVSDTAALLLPTNAQLRFLPAANYNGAPGQLQVRLADSTITYNSTNPQSDITASIGGTRTWSNDRALLRTTVNAINDAPNLSGSGVTIGYTEQEPAVNVGSGLTGMSDIEISRNEVGDILTATVTIGNFLIGDRLTFTPGSTGITITDNGSGVYTLSGSSRGNLLQVLQTAAYSSTSDNPTNFGASNSRTITFRVNDGQATNNLSNTVVSTVNVTGVNDTPAGSDRTVSTPEDTNYTFTLADFPFTDVDSTAVSAVRIDTLPANGTLRLNGNAIAPGAIISTNDITSGRLVFVPEPDVNRNNYTTFTFSVRDNSGVTATEFDPTPNTVTVNLTPVNDAPIATGSANLTSVNEDSTDPAGTVLSTLLASNYSDATDTVVGGSTGTALAGVAIVGNAATAAQGTWQYFNGTNWLNIPTSGLSTNSALVLAANTQIRFRPAANFNGTPGALTVYLSDGASLTAGSGRNISSQIGGIGGWSESTVAIATTVNAINDAPIALGNATLQNTVGEDDANPAGETVSSLFNPRFSDPTDQVTGGSSANTLAGIAIAGNATTSGQGAWEYFDGTNWVSVGVRTPATALILDASTQLRFVPASNYNGSIPDLTVHLIDNSSGNVTTGTVVNLSGTGAIGGTTPYSATPVPLSGTVTPINDPPAGSDRTLTATEDTPFVLTAAHFGFSDVDNDAFQAVRIDTLPSNGRLTLNGVDVSDDQVISIADVNLGRLVFTADTNENGSNYTNFTFSVQDSNNTFDTAPNTLTFNVTPVNDAPVANGTATLPAISEDTTNPSGEAVSTLFSSNFSDTTDQVTGGSSANTLAGIAIANNAATPAEGIWQYFNGTTWVDVGSRTPGNALVVAESGLLRFVPAANYNGPVPNLTVHLIDSSNGTVTTGTTVNLGGPGATGGTTPYSGGTVTLGSSVNPVNDPPTGSDRTLITTEDTPYSLQLTDFGFNDIDGHTFQAVRIDTLPANGTLTLNGNLVAAGDVISTISIGQLVFTPAPNANGNNYTSFTFSVQDSSGDFDLVPNTFVVNVTPAEEPPTGTNKTLIVTEDTGYPLTAADFGFNDEDGHTFQAVRIDTLPANGRLTLNGNLVTDDQVIDITDINNGRLVFTPASNVNGDGYTSFTFSVQDSSNVFDATPNTLTVNVTPANDPPTGTDFTINAIEDTEYSLSPGEFGFGDLDGHTFQALRIDSLPTNGSLRFNGNSVVAGQVVNVADVGAGLLVFIPAVDANGSNYANFTFSVQDSSNEFDTVPNTATINVAPTNDPPTGTNNTVSTLENTGYQFTATDFGFGDVDGHTFQSVRIDTLPINGRLILNSNPVADGQVISITEINAGLLVFNPDPNANGANYANFTFSVEDSSNTFDPTPNTLTIDVGAVNVPPTGTDTAITIDEDTSYFLRAADFGFADTDGHSFTAVRIDALPLNGTLTLNGSSFTAGQIIPLAAITAGRLIYTPALNRDGPNYASFTFSVQDSSGDFDTVPNTFTVNVTPFNDPPVVDLDGNNSSGVTGNNYRTLFTAGTPVAIADLDTSVTDPDDTNLQSAVITLVNRLDGVNEQLGITSTLPAGITATAYNPSTGELRLTGNASRASYQTAIASILYNNSARIRNTADRLITVVVSDGRLSSPMAMSSILADYDGDRIPDNNDLDDDNDGIPDLIEMGDNPSRDTDGDGVIDRFDLDSDNDGITDLKESGLPANVIITLDTNNDGVIDSTQSFGNNGLSNTVETQSDSGLISYIVIDTDRDGRFNFQDIDSDNDGISDLRESGYDLPDFNGDGRADGPDTDGDGLPDPFDGLNNRFGGGSNYTTLRDTDGDGLPDPMDTGRNLNGSTGADIIFGGDGDDILNGFSDRDALYGRGGNDLINGGSDPDTLRGDEGNDILNGGTNNDDMDGGIGNDILNGGDGDDLMRGGEGNDILNGGRGRDRIFGGPGTDTLTGGDGDDQISGGQDDDFLMGGRGNDILNGGRGRDRISGGQGNDVFVYRSALSFGDTIQDFEIVRDRIDLSGIFGGNGSMRDLRLRQAGTDTQVQVRVAGQFSTLGTLENVNASTLRATHFIF